MISFNLSSQSMALQPTFRFCAEVHQFPEPFQHKVVEKVVLQSSYFSYHSSIVGANCGSIVKTLSFSRQNINQDHSSYHASGFTLFSNWLYFSVHLSTLGMSVCPPIYSETAELVVTKCGKKVWSVDPFIYNNWRHFVLSLKKESSHHNIIM